jgi:RsiW-degrading membrane proteinase PrsW (M82 family)
MIEQKVNPQQPEFTLTDDHVGVSNPKASIAWLLNTVVLFVGVGIFYLAFKETGRELNLRTVLYGLVGVFGLLVNALLIVFWLRGSARSANSSDG